MSKKIKTIEELKTEIEALQQTYAERKAAEARLIGEYVQRSCAVDTLADFQQRFEVVKKGAQPTC